MSDGKKPSKGLTEESPKNPESPDVNYQDGSQSSSITMDSARRRPQQPLNQISGYGSITSSSNPLTADNTSTIKSQRRPVQSRRTTSTNVPHRGQEFSVDDAEEEVDEDLQHQKQPPKKVGGTLKREPSTLRRRPTVQVPTLARVESSREEEATTTAKDNNIKSPEAANGSSAEEITLQNESDDVADEVEDEDDLSDAESFTLKDRQEAINETHPFGIRIWKPALYKKDRSVQRNAEGDIHSTPGLYVSNWIYFFNFAWSLVFGWWLAVLAAAGGLLCVLLACFGGGLEYGKVLWGLSSYLLYPFGKYVKLYQDEAYAEEDEGEGRSISEYEQWQSGDIEEGRLFFGPSDDQNRSIVGRRRSFDSIAETQSLLGRSGRGAQQGPQGTVKRRLFGRGKWTLGRVIFFIVFYGLLTPILIIVSGICWLFVFTIPMGRVTWLLVDHLRRHPLALSFHRDAVDTRRPGDPASSILVCTYRAVGSRYWKYTIDGTNIFFINLLSVVAFAIFDYWVLDYALGLKIALTNQFFVFMLSLFSIIPLAYFIGQAVASISAQSSMGVGATINALFSTIVEVFLYCVALNEGKAQLVEGSIVGSIFAGILFLPGLSMCFGALRRKTQRFNVKSAGVTSTMLLFAVIGVFGPTLFYQIYGSHQLNCHQCIEIGPDVGDCRRCFFAQNSAVRDRFFEQAVLPFVYFAAVMLFLSYIIGLLFTLRTHAAVIWKDDGDEKKDLKTDLGASGVSASIHSDRSPLAHPEIRQNLTRSDIRESQLYKRILGQSLKQAGLSPNGELIQERPLSAKSAEPQTPHIPPPREQGHGPIHLEGLSEEQNQDLALHVAEMAATAAAVAARDAVKAPRRTSQLSVKHAERPPVDPVEASGQTAGGHDAPNWSRVKSAVILLTATIAYAVIAEILVNTVDAVLENVDIDEKFLGITLFALVPNTTEFLNAISFAMNGNIALSMEIGSAYALQVCLLQIPALVLYSAIYGRFIDPSDVLDHTFTLIFPQWDMVTTILCVFLLSYMYGEGKSNYFKGSILILAYLVVITGFYLSKFTDMNTMGIDRFDTLAAGGLIKGQMQSASFKTVGRSRNGRAY